MKWPVAKPSLSPAHRIIQRASQDGHYGDPGITASPRHAGWRVNHKRVERLWRQEELQVLQKQPKRGRLRLDDGSCVRLSAPSIEISI